MGHYVIESQGGWGQNAADDSGCANNSTLWCAGLCSGAGKRRDAAVHIYVLRPKDRVESTPAGSYNATDCQSHSTKQHYKMPTLPL